MPRTEIAIFPELLAMAAGRDPEGVAEAVRGLFGPRREGLLPSHNEYLNRLRQAAGIGYKTLPACRYPCVLASDQGGSFQVTIVAPEPAETLPAFTFAHLLGHFFMDLQLEISRGGRLHSGLKEISSPERRYLDSQTMDTTSKEGIADQFAAALMLPREKILSGIAKGLTPAQIAQGLGVGNELAGKRLSQLWDRESQGQPQNFDAAEEMLRQGQAAAFRNTPFAESEKPASPRPGANAAERPPLRSAAERPTAPASPGRRSGAAAGPGTKAAAEPSPSGQEAAGATETSSRPGGKGMARLREIAAQLERRPPQK